MVSLSLHLEIYSSRHQYVRYSFLKTQLTCIQDWPVLFGKIILRLQSDINIFSGITVIAFGDLFQSPSVCQRFFFEDTTDLYTRLASYLGKTISDCRVISTHLVESLSLHLEIYSSRHQYVRDSFLKLLLTCIQDWRVLFGKTILRLQSYENLCIKRKTKNCRNSKQNASTCEDALHIFLKILK